MSVYRLNIALVNDAMFIGSSRRGCYDKNSGFSRILVKMLRFRHKAGESIIRISSMRLKLQKISDWLIYMPIDSTISVEDIIELQDKKPAEVLRKHHRSIVEKKQLDDVYYIVKQPNNKNHSYWIRFTTLYRDSEVLKDLKSQLLLEQLRIPTVKPIAALEKRKFGMVVDSNIIYLFRPGEQITEEQYSQMLSFMQVLHRNGYLHDDPHIKNFLQFESKAFAIDCKPRKNLFLNLGIAHNNITLARRSENPQVIYDLLGVDISKKLEYRLVNRFIELQQFRRSIKNRLRKLLGIDYKNKD